MQDLSDEIDYDVEGDLGANHVDQQDAEQVIRCNSHDDDDDDDDEYSYDDDDDDYDSCNDDDDEDDCDDGDDAREENNLWSRCGSKVTDSSHSAILLTSQFPQLFQNFPQRHRVAPVATSSDRRPPCTPDLPFPLRSFARCCFEAAQDYMSELAFHPEAILALCAAAEDHLLEFFEVSLGTC